MSATQLGTRSGAGSWTIAGLVAGVIAGIIFAMFEMIMAAIMGPSFFAPLRMIGAIVLGAGALELAYSLATAGIVGLIVHMMLSAVYGGVFGAVVSTIGALRRSRGALIGVATVFGLALWIVNFYVIAPVAFPWFAMANPAVQFFAHTFFFGTALGLMLASRAREEG